MRQGRGRRGGGGGRDRRRGRADTGAGAAHEQGPKATPLHPTTDVPAIESFREWPLASEVQDAIAAMAITTPTPIQRLAIGPVLAGKDVIAKAETGTGKTLAFGAPMMSRLDSGRSTVLGLVLCPTRELAQQVAGVLEKLGAPRGLRVALIVGGEPPHPQVEALKRGAQVVVGTPGRVLDLYGQRFLSFPWTEVVVLDEADEMFEIGFIDDVKKILAHTPDERQTLLFSATFPPEVLRLARECTRQPVELATAAGIATVKTIEQSFVRVGREDRALALMRLIESSEADDVFLVFCERRTEVDALMRRLERLPFAIKALHGGYDQAARFRVMGAFRTGEVKALVATDVASRGLDVHLVTHVVNYSVPHDPESYTHRIGRTGRAGRSGNAITIVSPENDGRWRFILRSVPWDIAERPMPERARTARPARDEARPRDQRREPRERRARVERAPAPEVTERPQPARSPAPALAPDDAQRPRRAMSTRERLALERAGTPSASAPDGPAARREEDRGHHRNRRGRRRR